MTEFSNQQKLEAAEREVKQRVRVYKRLIETGKMTLEKANYETDIMRAIADDYYRLAAKERLI